MTDGRSHDCADRLAADLRQAGLTAWTSPEYSRAFAALLGAELPLLFADFDVVCLERRGQGGLIGAVAARYAQSVYELGARSAAPCDAAVETLGLLAHLPGVSFGTADARQSYALPMKPQRLAGLLGMETLKDIKGWVESRSARRVQLRVCLPSAAHQGYTLSVSLPLGSCPALQESNLKDGLAETEMKEQVLMEPDNRLRRYQEEMKAAVWKAWQKARRVMLQMPTGTGKTRLFVSLIRDIRQADADARILIVAHRTELIGQISRALSVHYGLEHHVLGNGNAAAGAPILLASIQMLARRIGKDARLQAFGYIIIDEAHHSLAPTYRKMLEAYPAARVLGVTATPCRLKRTSFAALYGQLVESAPMRQFLHEGYLAPYRLFTVSDRAAALSRINRLTKFGADGDYRTQDLKEIIDTGAETEQLYDCYRQCAAGRKGIVYAVSRAHAARIAALFRHKGVAAAAVDCDTPPEERQALIARFKEKGGGVDVLVNVELFTEGFDCPGIGFVMLARPTRSLALYLQQVGRALRPTPGGGEVVILDCAGLYNRFGLPERRRDWQAHFAGIRPQGEDYVRRPLGSPAVGGLMQEVERRQKQVADTGGDTCVYTSGGGLYGLCDRAGRVIFRPQYEKITPTPYGWYIGERREKRRKFCDVLSPGDAKIYSFLNIKAESDGTFSALRAAAPDASFCPPCRFDRNLRLIPSKTISISPSVSIFQHGTNDPGGAHREYVRSIKTLPQTDVSFYTTHLALDAPVYDRLLRIAPGTVRLHSAAGHAADLLITAGEAHVLKGVHKINGRNYLATQSGLLLSPGGTVYRAVRPGFPLFYAGAFGGVTLYDAHLSPLIHGASIEIFPDRSLIHRYHQPPLTITYIDYLCEGIAEKRASCSCAEGRKERITPAARMSLWRKPVGV